MLSCFLKDSGLTLIFERERVFRKLYNFVCARCKFFYNALILVLHDTTTSHACLLQTIKIAPAASAKRDKPILNMQVD